MSEVDIREIKVIKIPREKPLMAFPANFRELDINSLGLPLLEIKSKLKPNPPTLKSVREVREKTPTETKAVKPSKVEEPPPKKPKVQGKATTEDEIAKVFAESKEEGSIEEEEEEPLETDDEAEGIDDEAEDGENEQLKFHERKSHDSSEVEFEISSESEQENKEVGEALEGPKTIIEEAPPEETEMQKKIRILRRLRTLKKVHPTAMIPDDFDEDDDLGVLSRTLENIAYDLKVDQNVAFYRTILCGYFGGVEFISGLLGDGFDMVGFASHQFKIMHQYDSLLLEVAEEDSGGWVSNLPPKVKLLGFMILNTAVFFAFKYISRNRGSAAAGAFMGFYEALPIVSKPPPPATKDHQAPEAPKQAPAFRGPSTNLEDLKKRIGSTSSESESSE